MQSKDFLIRSQGVVTALRMANWVAWKFLAATTAVLAYAMLSEFLSEHLSGTSLFWATAVGVVGIYFLIDSGMASLLRFAFKMKGESTTKSQRIFTHFIVLLCILKVVATMTTSIWAAPEMADVITTNEEEEAVIAALLRTDSSQQSTVNAALLRRDQLEANEAQRIARAKREGKELIEAAIREGNKWQRSSYRKIGFAWLQSPKNPDRSDHAYARRIQAAQQRALELVEAERQRTTSAMSEVHSISSDSSYQRTAALLAQKADQEHEEYLTKRSRRRGYIWLADVLAGMFGIICVYLLSVWEKAGEIEEPTKTVGTVLAAAKSKFRDGFLFHLETLLGVDIDGDGFVGTPEADLKQAGTNADVPAVGMGFSAIKNRLKQEPETTGTETTQNAVATSVPAVSAPPPPPPETIVLKQTETRDDIEREVSEQVRRLQRYRSKWKNRGKGGGRPETIRTNIVDALLVIKRLRMNGKISDSLAKKVAAMEQWYLQEVKPEFSN